MKYFIIALLFCICYVGEAQRPESIIKIYGRTYYLDSLDNGWYYYRDWKDTVPFKKTKPLNIKMKPRNKIDTTLTFGKYENLPFSKYETIYYDHGDTGWLSTGGYDTFLHKVDSIKSKWTDASKATKPTVFTITPIQDTIRCVLLCSDTSSQNGYRTQRCYWMYGYKTRCFKEDEQKIYSDDCYFDERKIPLQKNILVWMSKEVK